MQVTINRKQKVEAKTLHIEAGVRYWDDATVDGVEDSEDAKLIPCRDGNTWKPIIDIDKGQIINWRQGATASVHYKVCDDGSYYIKDDNGNVVMHILDDYVPDILSPDGGGYGDYIIMEIDQNGMIQGWKVDLSGFNDAE